MLVDHRVAVREILPCALQSFAEFPSGPIALLFPFQPIGHGKRGISLRCMAEAAAARVGRSAAISPESLLEPFAGHQQTFERERGWDDGTGRFHSEGAAKEYLGQTECFFLFTAQPKRPKRRNQVKQYDRTHMLEITGVASLVCLSC